MPTHSQLPPSCRLEHGAAKREMKAIEKATEIAIEGNEGLPICQISQNKPVKMT